MRANKLQVKINNDWKYVFCRNHLVQQPIVTDSYYKALHGTIQSLTYFTNYYSEYNFRISNEYL